MDPAKLLRAARQLRGLSQRDLAARAGVAQSVLARIESGAAAPHWATVSALLAAAELDLQLCLPASPLSEQDECWLGLSTSARLYWALGGRRNHLHDRHLPVWTELGGTAAGRCVVLDPSVSVGIWLEEQPAPPTPSVWTPTELDVWGRELRPPAVLEVRRGPVGTRGLIPVGVTSRDEVWAHPPAHPALQTDPVTSRRLRAVAAALHEGKRRDEQGRRGAAHKDSRNRSEYDFVMTRRRFAGLPNPDPRERRDWRLGGEASFRQWLGRRGFRLHLCEASDDDPDDL